MVTSFDIATPPADFISVRKFWGILMRKSVDCIEGIKTTGAQSFESLPNANSAGCLSLWPVVHSNTIVTPLKNTIEFTSLLTDSPSSLTGMLLDQ